MDSDFSDHDDDGKFNSACNTSGGDFLKVMYTLLEGLESTYTVIASLTSNSRKKALNGTTYIVPTRPFSRI